MGYLIKQSSTAQPLMFFMQDSTASRPLGKTGLTPTVTLSKNGGAFASPAGAVSEVANGWYKVAGNATDSATLGPLTLYATATGADPCTDVFGVVAYDPQDATALGISRLDAAITTRQATLTLPTNFSSLSIDGSGRVDVAKVAGTAQTARDLGAQLDATVSSRSTLTAANVWDALTSGFSTAGSVGKRIVDFLTGDAFGRLGAPAGASVSADIAAARAKIDTTDARVLLALPNAASNVAGGLPVLGEDGAAIPTVPVTVYQIQPDAVTASALKADAVTEISDRIERTDGPLYLVYNWLLNMTTLVSGLTRKFTAAALSLAPSGGGGSGSPTYFRGPLVLTQDGDPLGNGTQADTVTVGQTPTLRLCVTDQNGMAIPLGTGDVTITYTNAATGTIVATTTEAQNGTNTGIVDATMPSAATVAGLANARLLVKASWVDSESATQVATGLTLEIVS